MPGYIRVSCLKTFSSEVNFESIEVCGISFPVGTVPCALASPVGRPHSYLLNVSVNGWDVSLADHHLTGLGQWPLPALCAYILGLHHGPSYVLLKNPTLIHEVGDCFRVGRGWSSPTWLASSWVSEDSTLQHLMEPRCCCWWLSSRVLVARCWLKVGILECTQLSSAD